MALGLFQGLHIRALTGYFRDFAATDDSAFEITARHTAVDDGHAVAARFGGCVDLMREQQRGVAEQSCRLHSRDGGSRITVVIKILKEEKEKKQKMQIAKRDRYVCCDFEKGVRIWCVGFNLPGLNCC